MASYQFVINAQIVEACRDGVPMHQLAQTLLILPNGERIPLFNLALKQMNGRNKLFKFLASFDGIFVDGGDMNAIVYPKPAATVSSLPLKTSCQEVSNYLPTPLSAVMS